jgi:hypothetical protein
MADKQFLRLNEKWALAHDDLQWIVQRRQDESGTSWRGVAFVRSNKSVLLRMIRWNNIKPIPEAQAVLEAMPETFDQWLATELKKQRLESLSTSPAKVPELETAGWVSTKREI